MRIKNLILTLKMPRKYDKVIHFAVLVLILFGTIMIISTNVGNSSQDPLIIVKVLIKQVMFIIASYILMTFFANNFTLTRAKSLFLPVGVMIFIALLSTQFFQDVNGSKAWIRIPLIQNIEITLQPSEFAKVFMIVIMALFIKLASNRNYEFWTIVRFPVFFFIAFAAAILLQKDMGAILVMGLICAVCFLISSHKNLRKQQIWVKRIFLFGAIAMFFVMSQPVIDMLNKVDFLSHVAVRIENAINPFTEPHGKGYQLINGLYGFARGGLPGVGLGNSIQKYGYLTQSDNDFILSIIVEETGLFGLMMVTLGYFVIICRLFVFAYHSKSEAYKIILVGTAMYIFVHFALNVGGVSGLIPLTGVPLLFISSGGSSLMSIMTAIGISQSVIAQIRRQGTVVKRKKEPQGVGGSLRKGRGETKIGG